MRASLMLTTALVALCTPQVAAAQAQLEEVIVTAQKRSENLQDAPVAVTAATGEQLEAARVEDATDIAVLVPSLRWNLVSGIASPFMRGVGSKVNGPGIENSFATYVDGVYYQSSVQSAFPLSAVERVEVLKGPQGTLFGRNTTAGLVHYVTKAPSHAFEGEAEVGYGNYETLEGNLYLTGGLSETVAANLAVGFQHQGRGFGTNLFTGTQVNTERDLVLRSKWLWEPRETTSVTFAIDYSRATGTQGITSHPVHYLKPAGGPFYVGPPWSNFGDTDPVLRAKQGGASLRIEQEVGAARFMSLSAYRRSEFFLFYDADRVTAFRNNLGASQPERQFTQEFQLLSPSGGRLTWVAGALLYIGRGDYDPVESTGSLFAPAVRRTIESRQDTRSVAVFAQGTYALTDTTNLTVGGRLTSDRKDFSGIVRNHLADGSTVVLAQADDNTSKAKYETPTWRIALDHHLSDDLMVYASYNRGFKSGAFQTSSFPRPPIEPEYVDAYELGWKADLFDRRARINGALFYYDNSNMQTGTITNGIADVFNAARAEFIGLDIDAEVLLTEELRLVAGFGHLFKNEYVKYPAAPCYAPNLTGAGGNTTFFCDASGKDTLYAPKTTLNLTLTYRKDTSVGAFSASANYYYSGSQYLTPDNFYKEPSYQLIGGEVSWTSLDEKLSVRVWGKNLANEVYANDVQVQVSGNFITEGSPRRYGISLERRF